MSCSRMVNRKSYRSRPSRNLAGLLSINLKALSERIVSNWHQNTNAYPFDSPFVIHFNINEESRMETDHHRLSILDSVASWNTNDNPNLDTSSSIRIVHSTINDDKSLGEKKHVNPNLVPHRFHNFIDVALKKAWRIKFGMIECGTTDIPEFRNYEYWNSERWVIRLFYLWIYFLLLFF